METRYDRLLQLADHLEKGKLIHREFNFYYFNFGEEDETGCGTAGCAIGECPAIFPEWKFDYSFPVFNEATGVSLLMDRWVAISDAKGALALTLVRISG